MKLTEIKRRVDRIKKHAEEGKHGLATNEENELACDFVMAAASGAYGDKARSMAKEIALSFEVEIERVFADEER